MTTQRLIISFNMVFWLAFGTTREAQAWWSIWIGGDTHWDITKDALSDASITKDENPDLKNGFAEQLRDGSNTESHNVPDENDTEWWWPTEKQIDSWFSAGRIMENGEWVEGALSSYTNYNFNSAYFAIGRELHLVQDQSVPAHKLYCCHGESKLDTDDLEKTASLFHYYGPLIAEKAWTYTFVHSAGTTTFHYWLDDKMDDDDLDEEGGDPDDESDGETKFPDGPTHDWGVANTEWGTYGQPQFWDSFNPSKKVLWEKWPGRDQGVDYFWEQTGNRPIVYGQLQDAYNTTLARMKLRSEKLPPLVPDDDTHGKPSLSAKIFGPNKPVAVSFVAIENRKKTVSVSILAGATGIKDTTGKIWDGGVSATYDLAASSPLPWKGTITCSWNGDLGSGQIDDGLHSVAMKVKDKDGNLSEARVRSVKFDKTKPKGTVTVSQ